MITIDGRFFAVVAMLAASSVAAALAIAAGVSNRITVRDVLGFAACVVVYVVAALWLWRHPKGGPA